MINSITINIIFSISLLGILSWMIVKIIEKNKKKSSDLQKDITIFKSKKNINYDKRMYPRINLNVPVKIQTFEDDCILAETKDISFLGAFIITKTKFSINERIKLNILSQIKPNTWLDAIVIWTNSGLPENKVIIPGFGVKFVNVKENEKMILSMLLSEVK